MHQIPNKILSNMLSGVLEGAEGNSVVLLIIVNTGTKNRWLGSLLVVYDALLVQSSAGLGLGW